MAERKQKTHHLSGWKRGEHAGDVVDADGFEIATVPATAVLDDWPTKFPKLTHWAQGGDRTARERTEEEVEQIADLIMASPHLLAALHAEGGPDAMHQTATMLENDYPHTSNWLRRWADVMQDAINKAAPSVPA